MKFAQSLVGFLLSPWLLGITSADIFDAAEFCSNTSSDEVGVGICEDYYTIDCNVVFEPDCAVLKFLYEEETGSLATWEEGTGSTRRMAALRGFGSNDPANRDLQASGADCCSGLKGRQRGMCIGYHSIGKGSGSSSCIADPTKKPCVKIGLAYEIKFGVAIPCGDSNEEPEATTPTTQPPTKAPTTDSPSKAPTTDSPSKAPTKAPTTDSPSKAPTKAPTTDSPSKAPTKAPTTDSPSKAPTKAPTTDSPSKAPTKAPTTDSPSKAPTKAPTTDSPSKAPTKAPTTDSPSKAPTKAPTTDSPSKAPTKAPTEVAPVPSLEFEILQDMMPPSSSQCPGVQTSTSFTFQSSQAESEWWCPFTDFEEGLFLAEMEHVEADVNRSWTMRMGQAGNIYSLVGPMGETVPPQEHGEAPWVDEVWQQVQPLGSNGDQDNDPSSNPYFIHEAGTYQRDGQGCAAGDLPYPIPTDCNGELDLTTSGSCSGPDSGGRISCPLVAQVPGFDIGYAPNVNDPGVPVVLEGTVSGQRVNAGVRHWRFSGNNRLYFYPRDGLTLADYNNALSRQKINIYYPPDPAFDGECFDYTATPFFSPTLGSYCNGGDGECGFMSWGQQAHLPTPWESPILYMNRYRNCGDGVIEYTQLRHNNGGSTPAEDRTFTYANAPWGGTRRSVLKDVVFTNDAMASPGHELIESPPGWGSESVNRNLKSTLGYTMFVQEMLRGDDLGLNGVDYDLPSGWVGRTINTCQVVGACGDLPRYRCELDGSQPTNNAGTAHRSTFTTSQGTTLNAGNVVHWANEYQGRYFFYFCGADDLDLATVQAGIPAGSTITSATYYYPTTGKRPDDNLALAHVHGGQDAVDGSSRSGYPRVRYGEAGRDFNVYTINPSFRMGPGDTYHYRQYFLMDSYSKMATTGPTWATEAGDDTYAASSRAGREVKLYSSSNSFGFAVGSNVCPNSPVSSVICTGMTTPQSGYKALFFIQCGSTYAVTSDPYEFAPVGPEISGGTKQRPYQCAGEAPGTRPVWKLLGFFAVDSCAAIASGFQFDGDMCAPLQS